jgi:hypothetical protein
VLLLLLTLGWVLALAISLWKLLAACRTLRRTSKKAD